MVCTQSCSNSNSKQMGCSLMQESPNEPHNMDNIPCSVFTRPPKWESSGDETNIQKYVETRMFLCLLVKNSHVSTKTCMYFLHLVLTFTPHYIIMLLLLKSLFMTFTSQPLLATNYSDLALTTMFIMLKMFGIYLPSFS